MTYQEWMRKNWTRLVVDYLRRPEHNGQGWIEWTYDQYQKATQEARARV